MSITKVPRFLFAALAAVLVITAYPGRSFADAAADSAALKEQMRIMMQRIDELTKQVDTLSKQQAPPAAPAAAPAPGAAAPAPKVAKEAPPTEPKFDKFLKGFYGTLDVSFDDTTKGINGLTAYSYSLSDPAKPNSTPVQGPPKGAQQVGRLGYMPAFSTNKSQIGYRNTHKIGETDFDFLVQVETSLSLTAAPGLRTSNVQQSNVVTGAIGLGDTFLGLQNKDW